MEFQLSDHGGDIFSASRDHEFHNDPSMKPCPFCGSADLLVGNTWTPYYSVECECCGASISGDFEPPAGMGAAIYGKEACLSIHEQAFNSAINAWNDRVGE